MASRRTAIAGPKAKRIPSIMSATITPDDISTERPRASSRDQKSDAGMPRYMQVTRPMERSRRGGIVLRKKSGATRTSLSLMMKYDRDEAAIILSKEKTLALGQAGGPDRIMRLGTCGLRARISSATLTAGLSASRAPKTTS